MRAPATKLAGPFRTPQNLGPEINSPYFDGPAKHLRKRQNPLLGFGSAGRLGGLRYLDGDAREAVCETVGPAVNVGPPVNTPGPHFGPAISDNERQLFFKSGRPGNVGQIDIWVVERRKNKKRAGPWGTPINVDTLNSPFFQAMPTFHGNGKGVCFMSVRPDGFGALDIWCADRSH